MYNPPHIVADLCVGLGQMGFLPLPQWHMAFALYLRRVWGVGMKE